MPRASVPHSSELRMTVIRADGTIHDHGVVDAHYRNPLKQGWWILVRRPLADRRIRRSNKTAGRN